MANAWMQVRVVMMENFCIRLFHGFTKTRMDIMQRMIAQISWTQFGLPNPGELGIHDDGTCSIGFQTLHPDWPLPICEIIVHTTHSAEAGKLLCDKKRVAGCIHLQDSLRYELSCSRQGRWASKYSLSTKHYTLPCCFPDNFKNESGSSLSYWSVSNNFVSSGIVTVPI